MLKVCVCCVLVRCVVAKVCQPGHEVITERFQSLEVKPQRVRRMKEQDDLLSHLVIANLHFFLFNLSVLAFVSVWLRPMTFSGLLSHEARERNCVCIFSTFVFSGLQYRRSVTLQECHVRPDRVGERSRSSD